MALTKVHEKLLEAAAKSVLVQQVYAESKTYSGGNAALAVIGL